MSAERHLRLVPPLPPTDDELGHAKAMQGAANLIRYRGGRLELTVTDPDGVELSIDPATSTHRAFVVRAEATFTRRVERFPLRRKVARTLVGICDPVPRDDFLNDPSWRRSAEAEAVLDLIQQLRPHTPAEMAVDRG